MERRAVNVIQASGGPAMPPGAFRRGLRTARLIHPFPTFLNVAATAGLAFVAADGSPDAATLARMLLVMLFAQSAIGVTNDWFDQQLDAQTKPWKPIVAGLVAPATAAAFAIALVAATVALALTLGIASFALGMLGMASGLAYDARLKRTMLSALPFMVAVPTLPVWVWVTAGEWERVLWWLLPLGALLGLAVHLANTSADIEADAAHGVRGLAHHLGRAGSLTLAWCAFAAALAIAVAVAASVDAPTSLYAAGGAFGALCLTASVVLYAWRRDAFAMQASFVFIGVGSVVVAPAWLAAVT